MIDFGRYKLTFNDAKIKVDTYDGMTPAEFDDQVRHWAVFDVPKENYDPAYASIRAAVVDEFKKVLADNDNKINYDLDLKTAIKLYELLNAKTGFDIIKANDDDIWRYITLCVMPDITFIRYPNLQADVNILREYIPDLIYTNFKTEKNSVRIKKKRFYSHTRRIWLKTLWWYVYLGWQGNSAKTYAVMRNNGTNIIGHFIERPGRGYREKLFRSMLYVYSMLPENYQKDKTFTAAAKLNLAKCVTVEPELTEGGEQKYSESLFDEVIKKGIAAKNVKKSDIE